MKKYKFIQYIKEIIMGQYRYSYNQNSFQCGEEGIDQKIIWQNPSVHLYYQLS